MKAKQKDPDIRALIKANDDGTLAVTIVKMNGPASSSYRYSTVSGKLEKNGRFPMEWIGSISLSPNLLHRSWMTIANLLRDMYGIPTEVKKLEKFIKARGEGKSCYRVQFSGPKGLNKIGSVYLPNLLTLAKYAEGYSEKDEAIISQVVVAPHRQRQGFGLGLHLLAASYLKGLGYTKMTSDIVGMNTDAEIAVWKALKKQVRVTPFKMSYSLTRFLRKLRIIDNTMFQLMQKKIGFHLNGALMAQEEISRKKFQQFEMDLTDKRIPKLVVPKAAPKAA